MEPPQLTINFDKFRSQNWLFDLSVNPFQFKSPRMLNWGFFEPFFDGYEDADLLRAETKFILSKYGLEIDRATQAAKEEILSDLAILVKRGVELPSDIEFTVKVRFAQ